MWDHQSNGGSIVSSRQALSSEERNKIAVESSTCTNNNHLKARVQWQNGYNIKNQDNLKWDAEYNAISAKNKTSAKSQNVMFIGHTPERAINGLYAE